MIKQLLLAAVLVAPVAQAEKLDCDLVADNADKFHQLRYLNVPADEAFKAALGEPNSLRMAHEAYTSPRYRSIENIEADRIEFRSRWFLWCYEVNNDQK